MRRFPIVVTVLVLCLASGAGAQSSPNESAPAVAPAPAPEPAPFPPGEPATAADVQPLLGDWVVPLETTSGVFYAYITLKAEADTLVALLSSDLVPEHRTTDIIKAGNGIKVRARTKYEGPLVERPTTVALDLTLTAAGDAMSAAFDFNQAAFFVSGTGRRPTP